MIDDEGSRPGCRAAIRAIKVIKARLAFTA